MNRKLIAVFILWLVSFSFFALSQMGTAATVFYDNFSTGNFANWSEAIISPGSSQLVSDGVARFVVPTPQGGNLTYSFLRKDGFTSTVNSTIIATQDIYVTKVPSGCPRENGAIFFLYICDSMDLSGNKGNFGVGIDGSSVWSLWIGGNIIYTYVFQTAGSPPLSNTWYHIVVTVDNPAQTVTLTVNGTIVINVEQQQFTDRLHPISLMSGMGEDWWSDGFGLQEVDIDNVELYISDAPMPTPSPVSNTASSGLTSPSNNPVPTPINSPSTPSVTTDPSAIPSPQLSPSQSPNSASVQALQVWLVLPVITAAVAGVAILIILKKRDL